MAQQGEDSVGRALMRYTAMRLLLFLAAFVLLRAVVDDALLALGGAVLASAVLGVPLLADQRRRVNDAAAARAERRAAGRGPSS